jgi:hypothetical protein
MHNHYTMIRRIALVVLAMGASAACVHYAPASDLPRVQWLAVSVDVDEKESYSRISDADADKLGCKEASNLPICSVGFPNSEEDSAFRSEVIRLAEHSSPRCRMLSRAMLRHLPQVRMYPRAVVTESRGIRYYGVGHSYRSEEQWQIRIARSLTDLNPRPIEQKVRTFRHEVAHTLGASEERLVQWSAEEYAERCG